MRLIAFRGATGFEAQISAVCLHWPYWRFMRIGCWPHLYIDRSE